MNRNIGIRLGTLLTILTIIFIVLKLVGVISWSWLTVFLPLIVTLIVKLISFIVLCWLFN